MYIRYALYCLKVKGRNKFLSRTVTYIIYNQSLILVCADSYVVFKPFQ